jgi:hypothetical protein
MSCLARAVAAVLCLAGASSASAATCTAEVGAREARELAGRCREVSPATHPPCNVSNSCELIREEIRRGCELAGREAPEWCEAETGQAPEEDED